MMHGLRGAVMICLATLGGACGIDELFVGVGDEDKKTPVPDDAGTGMQGTGGNSGDADVSDAEVEELDAAMGDAGVDPLDPFDWSTCAPSDDVIAKVEVPFIDASGQSLTTGPVGFGVAYRLKPGCEQVLLSAPPSFGPLPPGKVVLGEETCFAYRDLTLMHDDNRWLLAWVDNSQGRSELFAQHFDADLSPLTAALQVTDDDATERRPALAQLGTVPVLAFVSQDGSSRSLRTRRLDTNTGVTTVVASATGHTPEQLVLSPLGIDGAAVAWINEGGKGGVYLQALTEAGAPVGEPVQVSSLDGAAATLDMARQARGADAERGGAMVYSVQAPGGSSEVRFRRLSEQGELMADERVIVPSPLIARDASITAVGDGYAIAYRALPNGGEVVQPEIRMLFVTREGNVARNAAGRPITYRVADATSATGRLTVRLSVEGQLLLSWLDQDPTTGAEVLKHVRRPLNCQ